MRTKTKSSAFNNRKVVNDVAGRRNQEITYRYFYNGVQVDRLPDGYAEKASVAFSNGMNKCIRAHPEKLATLDGKDYVKIIPITSEQA